MLGHKEMGGGCPSVVKIRVKVTPEPLANGTFANIKMIGILSTPKMSVALRQCLCSNSSCASAFMGQRDNQGEDGVERGGGVPAMECDNARCRRNDKQDEVFKVVPCLP